MRLVHTLRFESRLAASPAVLWRHMTSPSGIHDEMRPWLHMRFPGGVAHIDDEPVPLGTPLYSCGLRLFGVLPLGRSRLTFTQWQAGVGFTEQSPMTGMRQWQHTRTIQADGSGTRLLDELVFEPRLLPSVTRWIVRYFFRHRHKRLRRLFPRQ